MADNNSYTAKQNIKKYTTQAKFDAIDKSDVPVGTEYNIVGSIAESDLDSDLQAKVNLTGDNLTTEVTGGKVKVKNPMTSTGGNGFELNSFYNATTGVTYFFPIETPIGHFATGIVPILGSVTGTKPGSTAPATYQGVFLPNAYIENNYGPNAYGMLTMSESYNSGNQIYILPYCASNPGVSYLLNNESLIAGNGITIESSSAGPGKIEISVSGGGGGGLPDIPDVNYRYSLYAASGVAGWTRVDSESPNVKANQIVRYWNQSDLPTYNVNAVINANMSLDGGSGVSSFVVYIPTSGPSTELYFPAKSGTLATLDDIPTGGGTTYTAGKNIAIDGTTIKTKDDVNFDTAVTNALTVATTGIFTRGPINRVPNINFGTSAEPLSATGLYSFCTVFTTTGNENKTTYGFKIPSVGGFADIRFPNVTYGNLVVQEQLKTIFGNQSIVGSGNIDLYRHNITISVLSNTEPLAWVYITYISSSNLKVDSLTDLKTLIKELQTSSKVSCTGYLIASHETIISIYNENNIVKCEFISPNEKSSVLLSECVITDSITTI